MYIYLVYLEKAMAPHSSTLAWKIPWIEEPGGLQSLGSLRVGHDWPTSLSLSCTGEGNGNPLQCSCLENPRDGGAWWAAVCGVAQSRTRLKRLSSSRSSRVQSLGQVFHTGNSFTSHENSGSYIIIPILEIWDSKKCKWLDWVNWLKTCQKRHSNLG